MANTKRSLTSYRQEKRVGNDTTPRSIRFTAAELDIIGPAAAEQGLPVSTFVRNAALLAAKTIQSPVRMHQAAFANVAELYTPSNTFGYVGTPTTEGRVRIDAWGGTVAEETTHDNDRTTS